MCDSTGHDDPSTYDLPTVQRALDRVPGTRIIVRDLPATVGRCPFGDDSEHVQLGYIPVLFQGDDIATCFPPESVRHA